MGRIHIHSVKLGFSSEAGQVIEAEMNKLADICLNKKRAREVLERSYSTYLSNITFSSDQLESFIEDVREALIHPDDEELHRALGRGWIFFSLARKMGRLPQKEIETYLRRKREYTERTRSEREDRVLSELERGEYFPILMAVARRKIQPSPNYREPPVRIIYTPMGGQSGYKKRMRRR